MPQVGIVIPVYKTEAYVSQTIESLLCQEFKDWTAVLVDDGSPDGAAAIAEEYARSDDRLRVIHQPNQGVSAARNNGIAQLGDAEFIAFLDSDDMWPTHTLRHLHEALTAHPSAPAAHGHAQFMSADGVLLDSVGVSGRNNVDISATGQLVTPAPDQPSDFQMLSVWCFILTGTVMLRNAVLKQVGGFDPSLRISEDWDLWLRVALVAPIAFLDEPVLYVRRHGASAMGNSAATREGELRLRRKWAAMPSLTPEQRRTFQEGHRLSCFLRLAWARESLQRGKGRNALRQSAQFLRAYYHYLRLRPAYAGRK